MDEDEEEEVEISKTWESRRIFNGLVAGRSASHVTLSTCYNEVHVALHCGHIIIIISILIRVE